MSSRTRTLATWLLGALLAAAGGAATPAWTPLGPFGGSVATLAVAPSDAFTLYATLGAQGAFRSADGGVSWTPIHAGTTTSNVAVDPRRTGTIYLATKPGGLQKSTDGGAHWTPLPLAVTEVEAVAVDPARATRLYAGTLNQGVWRSTDGGASWQPARVPLAANGANAVHELAVPQAGGIVYAGTDAGVFKSVDAALSWQPASHGLPAATVIALAVAPSAPKTVYAALASGVQQNVFRSRDGGASWQPTAGPPLRSPQGRVISLAVSPRSPNLVWAGADPGGIFRTTDGGAHWTSAGPVPERRTPAVAVAPSSPDTVYAGVTAQGLDLGGVFATADGGASWTRRIQGLAGLDAHALAVPPGSPGVLLAGLLDQGLFRSANSGRRWARVTLPGPSLPVTGIPLWDLEVAPSAPSMIYALAFSWLWRTSDGGVSWTEAYGYPDGPFLGLLRVDPADPSRLWGSPGSIPFQGSTVPLLRSTDGGKTWATAATPDLGCEIIDLQFAPSSPATLYVAGAQSDSDCKLNRASLFRSTDDGATWTAADAGLTAHSVIVLAVDPHDARLLYAGTGGDLYTRGDGVWKSTDGGASWARAGDDLQGRTITALTASPLPGVVWTAVAGGTVLRSGDGGATWSDVTDGLQAATIHRLTIDPADPRRVYAATSGGVWVLEDDEP